jgi:acyl-CoA thioesterase
MASDPPSRFERDTAVGSLRPGVYGARMDTGWWIVRGPNGGYVAAIVLRAMQVAVGDPGRTARSLTVHYLAPPREGEVEVHVAIERRGRQMTFASARLLQRDGGRDRLLATALGAFAAPLPATTSFVDARMPAVPRPADCAPMPAAEIVIPLRERYEERVVLDDGQSPVATSGTEAVSGGWIRFAEPTVLDHVALAAVADAWVPAVFSRLSARNAVPTIDLTVHFRARLPHPSMAADDWCLAMFRTRAVVDGFLEEDGEIWSPDGVLLAHSRQLGLLLPEG